MDGRSNIEMFTGVTGASEQVAAKYLQDAKGDIDMAIALFFSEQEPGEAAAAGGPSAAQAPAAAESQASVDSILEGAKARADQAASGEAGAGAAKGSGKGGPGGADRNVFIVFFSDGFMVDEDFEFSESKPEPGAPAAPAAAPARRTGMMSLNDLKKDAKPRGGPLPKLPKLKPLRSYDTPENKTFLADVKAGRLPPELQKRDEKGAPIKVVIAIEDVRPKSYEELAKVIKQMEGMQKEMEGEQGGGGGGKPPGPALFAGAGNTLSSGSSSSAPAAGGGSGGGGAGADPALVAIVSAGTPPQADESKPVASVQLRLSTGARVRARLNLDHTVADLWRLVAAEMGAEAFRAASGHQLVAGFPPKPLSDAGATLAAADLANAAVTHRCQ